MEWVRRCGRNRTPRKGRLGVGLQAPEAALWTSRSRPLWKACGSPRAGCSSSRSNRVETVGQSDPIQLTPLGRADRRGDGLYSMTAAVTETFRESRGPRESDGHVAAATGRELSPSCSAPSKMATGAVRSTSSHAARRGGLAPRSGCRALRTNQRRGGFADDGGQGEAGSAEAAGRWG